MNSILNWGYQLNFWLPNLIFGAILIFLLGKVFKNSLSAKLVNWALFLVLLILILQFAARALLTYGNLKADSSGLGKYLLPPYSQYFTNQLYFQAYDILINIAAAGIFFLLLWLIHRKRSEILDILEAKLGLLSALMVGFPQILPLVVLAFFLTLVASLFHIFKGDHFLENRVAIGPFILISAILVLIFQVPFSQFLYSFFKLA